MTTKVIDKLLAGSIAAITAISSSIVDYGEDASTTRLRGLVLEAINATSDLFELAPTISRWSRKFKKDDTGTTNSVVPTVVASFANMQTLLGDCAGIVRAYVYVQDVSNALAVQLISAGINVQGGALVSGGAGSMIEGSAAQGTAIFTYSGNTLQVTMTSADAVAKTYKVLLEVEFAPKT